MFAQRVRDEMRQEDADMLRAEAEKYKPEMRSALRKIADVMDGTIEEPKPKYTDEQIDAAAKAAHEVNRTYCIQFNDRSHQDWEDAPAWQRASVIAGVKAIIEDPKLTPRKSHEGWMKLKLAEGWKYGPVKDERLKTHPCLMMYDELPVMHRAKDVLFGATVRAVLGIEII